MGRYDEALADFNRAIELDPGNAWDIIGRGETYRLMGRYAAGEIGEGFVVAPHQPVSYTAADDGLGVAGIEFDAAVIAPAVQRRARACGRCAPRFRLDSPCCLH